MKIQKVLILLCSIIFMSIAIGLFSALFLYTLSTTSSTFIKNQWLMWSMPLIGFFVGYVYYTYGKEANKGTNYILHSISETKNNIPLRMAPFVYIGTLLSHLVGASAGREGTAVQVGGVVAENIRRFFRIDISYKPLLLLCGIAAGFSSVFGLPFAGIIFALELSKGKHYKLWYIAPIALCSFVSNWICLQTGIHHLSIPTIIVPSFNFVHSIYVVIIAICCLLVGYLFVICSKKISQILTKSISYKPFHPFVGGIVLLLGYYLVGDLKFAGLGTETITIGFTQLQPSTDFFFKLIFTALTIASGFKGGEVTPLFFIGVTLASALALFIPLPLSFLAALCFVGVFSSATKLPIASFALGVELFGFDVFLPLFIVSMFTNIGSKRIGIYSATE